MNTSQMLITVGALVLLSLVVLRVNNGFLTTDSVLLDSKLGVLATSVAVSIIEEAEGKAFDQETDSASVSDLVDLSSTLGPEDEVYPNFNDFDDYNGFEKIDTTLPAAEFDVSCEVNYIKESNLDGKSSFRTWHKKITVYVTSPSMYGEDGIPDTVTLSAIYSYWYFR